MAIKIDNTPYNRTYSMLNTIPETSTRSPFLTFLRFLLSDSELTFTSPSSTISLACPPLDAIPVALSKAMSSMYSPFTMNCGILLNCREAFGICFRHDIVNFFNHILNGRLAKIISVRTISRQMGFSRKRPGLTIQMFPCSLNI